MATTIAQTIGAGLALLCFTAISAPQDFDNDEIAVRKLPYVPRTEYAFRADSSVVEVGVVVQNGRGEAVPGLTKENFRILENGRPHEITSFTVQTANATLSSEPEAGKSQPGHRVTRPRFVALVFDDILTICPDRCKSIKFANWALMKAAAQRYLRAGVPKGDKICLIGFHSGQVLEFTDDPEKLTDGIGGMTEHWQVQKLPSETLSVLAQIVEYMRSFPGDKMLLLASGGLEAGEAHFFETDVINHALRSGVLINALDAKGLVAPGELPAGGGGGRRGGHMGSSDPLSPGTDDSMARLADETGGRYFHNNNDLIRGMRDLTAPAVKYILGFQQPDVHDGKFHSLKVKLSGTPRYEVDARPGYFAPLATTGASRVAGPLDEAAVAENTLDGLGARMTSQSQPLDAPGTGFSFRVTAHIDLKSIVFRASDDRHYQRISYVAVLFDSQGGYIAGGEAIIDLALRQQTFEHLTMAGINCTVLLSAPKGHYRLRTVIRDANGAISAHTEPVEIGM